jgi:DNA mismatch repair ATPase MutS
MILSRHSLLSQSYFDQAPEVARLLGIKLASRSWGGSRVHMCGFPLAHLDRHLKVLVAQGKRFVALCEEFRRVDGFFDRRVVRIVTPGTLIDESFLNQFENNYLLSISPIGPSTEVGLAWIDVSTGEFFSQSTTLDSLRDDLVRIGPREVVLHKSIEGQQEHPLHQALGEESAAAITYVEPNSTRSPTTSLAEDAYDPQDLSTPPVYTEQETSAVQLLTTFLQSHLLELMPELASPTRESRDTRMQIDSHTLRALEIKEAMREGGVTGSLLSTIKRTVTNGGTRLLARWLCMYILAPNILLPRTT